MKILKVYDTMNKAKFEAEKYYKECLDNGMDVRYRTPYRFDRIDDCTTWGIPDGLRACEYPL